MKLSKFVKRAKSESYCVVIHADDSGIWLGTRLALYNATELPYMEGKEQAGAVLDIDSKAWEKMFFDEKYTAHAGADFGMNLTETDPTEQEARRVPLEMFYKGMGLVGLVYGNGGELIFYDAALIAPIADVVKTSDYIQTVVRKTAGGAPYVVIKDGFEVLAGFAPLKIIYRQEEKGRGSKPAGAGRGAGCELPNPAQLESGGQVGRSVTQEKARRAAGQPKQQGQAQCGGQPRRCAARQ